MSQCRMIYSLSTENRGQRMGECEVETVERYRPNVLEETN